MRLEQQEIPNEFRGRFDPPTPNHFVMHVFVKGMAISVAHWAAYFTVLAALLLMVGNWNNDMSMIQKLWRALGAIPVGMLAGMWIGLTMGLVAEITVWKSATPRSALRNSYITAAIAITVFGLGIAMPLLLLFSLWSARRITQHILGEPVATEIAERKHGFPMPLWPGLIAGVIAVAMAYSLFVSVLT